MLGDSVGALLSIGGAVSRKIQRVLRFRITLNEIEPPVWRLIDVPETYSFWDLHVAIQDAMGWLDYHLHAFNPRRKRGRTRVSIGIPDEEYGDGTLAGWEIPIMDYFMEPGDALDYEYDFGDGWSHEIVLVGVLLKEPGRKYPVCLDGARACPPEDCGGVSGYEELLEILADPSHEEYEDMVDWLKGHAKNYYPYEPDGFDSDGVKFDNPKTRFRNAFSE